MGNPTNVLRECNSFSLDVSLTYLCTLRLRKTGDNGQKSFVSDYARNEYIGLLTILLFCSVRNIRKILQEIGVLISSNFPFECHALDMRGAGQNPSSKPYHYDNLQSFSSIILTVSEKRVRHINTDWEIFLFVNGSL